MGDATVITTPFGSDTTAAEVVAGIDLGGKRAIVTGASSGIGVETARALAAAGAEVTLAVRNTAAGEQTAAAITATTGNRAIRVRLLDLAEPDSIAEFAAGWRGPLHMLVNNAGIMALPDLHRTRQGWELQFATNHLGHFALARGLHRALAAAGGARIASVSSRAHLRSPVIFDDVHFESRPYQPLLAYAQSKTANVLFAVEASRRWADDGVRANALHPGLIWATELTRHMDADTWELVSHIPRVGDKTVEQGAATSVLVAASPLLEGVGGRYFENCNEAPMVYETGPAGVAPYALDPENAERLWELSEHH